MKGMVSSWFIFIIVLTLTSGLIFANTCYPDLPPPDLVVTGAEDYVIQEGDFAGEWTLYLMTVRNYLSFPDELFEPAPDLSPCGLNSNASRSWVEIYAADGSSIYGFCGLTSAEELTTISFHLRKGESPPNFVYIELVDRLCGLTYTSNLAPTVLGIAAPVVQDEGPVVITLQAGASIQEAIDKAPNGAEIHLSTGTYEGGLFITKPLTIKGVGGHKDGVSIRGTTTGGPVISINAADEIAVHIENLAVMGARGSCPSDSRQCVPGPSGIEVKGSVYLRITSVRIASNNRYGLYVPWPARVDVFDSAIHDNASDGVRMPGGQVLLHSCTVSGNRGAGINAWGNTELATLTVLATSIFDNKTCGIMLLGASSSVQGCVIRGNNFGIYLFCKATLTMSENHVYKNRTAGVGLHTRACTFEGYSADYYHTGEVRGWGNIIEENGEDLCPAGVLSSLRDP